MTITITVRAGGGEAFPKRYRVPQTGVLGAYYTQKPCFGPTHFQMDDLSERAWRVGTMEGHMREPTEEPHSGDDPNTVANNLQHYFNTERFGRHNHSHTHQK